MVLAGGVNMLDNFDIYGKSLPIDWAVDDVSKESRMFGDFPEEL